jgi:hypothetical protein
MGVKWRHRAVAQAGGIQPPNEESGGSDMRGYIDLLRQRVSNEKGAEIVEWVLWVGGIAILAGTLYTVVSGALTNTVTNIVGGITGVTGS